MGYLDIFGYISTVAVLVSFMMPSIKSLRIMCIVSCVMFTIYGILKHDPPVILTNVSVIVVNLIKLMQGK